LLSEAVFQRNFNFLNPIF